MTTNPAPLPVAEDLTHALGHYLRSGLAATLLPRTVKGSWWRPSPDPGPGPATARPIAWDDALRMASPDLAVEDVIDALDSFHCRHVVAALWADAVANRLESPAICLLSDEIPEVAETRRRADVIAALAGQ